VTPVCACGRTVGRVRPVVLWSAVTVVPVATAWPLCSRASTPHKHAYSKAAGVADRLQLDCKTRKQASTHVHQVDGYRQLGILGDVWAVSSAQCMLPGVWWVSVTSH
jgi:hypothetical protein